MQKLKYTIFDALINFYKRRRVNFIVSLSFSLGMLLPMLCLGNINVFIENLSKQYSIEDYKRFINWLGQEITLKTSDKEIKVTALDVLPDGRMKVDWCGNMLEISSAEVSLRL